MQITVKQYKNDGTGFIYQYGIIKNIWLCNEKLIRVFGLYPDKIIVSTKPLPDFIPLNLYKTRSSVNSKGYRWRWEAKEARGNFDSCVYPILDFLLKNSGVLYIKGE